MDERNPTRTAHSSVDRLDMDLSFLDDLWRDERPPNSFTAAEAAEEWHVTREVAGKRLQQMVIKGKLLRTKPSQGKTTYFWKASDAAPTPGETP